MARYDDHVVEFPGGRILYHPGHNDDLSRVENIDVEVALDDGTRWSVTFLTLDEIRRVMDRWQVTGEELGGMFFQCSDLVIVRQGGIEGMTQLIKRLHDAGMLKQTFQLLD